MITCSYFSLLSLPLLYLEGWPYWEGICPMESCSLNVPSPEADLVSSLGGRCRMRHKYKLVEAQRKWSFRRNHRSFLFNGVRVNRSHRKCPEGKESRSSCFSSSTTLVKPNKLNSSLYDAKLKKDNLIWFGKMSGSYTVKHKKIFGKPGVQAQSCAMTNSTTAVETTWHVHAWNKFCSLINVLVISGWPVEEHYPKRPRHLTIPLRPQFRNL